MKNTHFWTKYHAGPKVVKIFFILESTPHALDIIPEGGPYLLTTETTWQFNK